MTYIKQTWVNGPDGTPVNATRLNHMEDGIAAAATSGGGGLDDAGVAALVDDPGSDTTTALTAQFQPLDADLTAIAALTTTSHGRSLLTADDAATSRTLIAAAATMCLYLPGATGNNVTTPDSAVYNPTTSLDLRAAVALDDWSPSASATLIAHYDTTSGQRAYTSGVNNSGLLYAQLSATGSSPATIVSTVAPTVTDGAWLCVRQVWTSTPNVTFYTKPFVSVADLALDTGWKQLGSVVTATVPATIFDSTAVVTIGEMTSAATPMHGKIAGAIIKIDGVTVASPDFTVPVSPRTRDAQGRLWTFNGSLWGWSAT